MYIHVVERGVAWWWIPCTDDKYIVCFNVGRHVPVCHMRALVELQCGQIRQSGTSACVSLPLLDLAKHTIYFDLAPVTLDLPCWHQGRRMPTRVRDSSLFRLICASSPSNPLGPSQPRRLPKMPWQTLSQALHSPFSKAFTPLAFHGMLPFRLLQSSSAASLPTISLPNPPANASKFGPT